MLPFVEILHFQISTYTLFFAFGVLLSLALVLILKKQHKLPAIDILCCFLYELIGMVIGARVLYLLNNLDTLLTNPSLIIFGGFKFLGAVLGGTAGIYIYSKHYKILFTDLLASLIITFPAIYTVSKIGCFFAGCCTGIEYYGIGNILDRFPIQILDSFFNLTICLILITIYKMKYKTIGLYFVLYGSARFLSDYLRTDFKEFIFAFSLIQLLCVILIVIGLSTLKLEHSRK